MMLTRMHLKNFKGFRDTEIAEFRKVNLIVGGQNVGKTSLLEAVVFVAGDVENSKGSRSRLPKIFRPNEGNDSLRFWHGIVGALDKLNKPLVMVKLNDEDYLMGGYVVGNSLQEAQTSFVNFSGGHLNPSVTTKFFNIEVLGGAHLITGIRNSLFENLIVHPFSVFSESAAEQVKIYGQLVIKKKKKTVLKLLQKIEPRIVSIDAVAPDDEHRVYVELNNGQVLPLSQLGHGFTRLFELYSGLAVIDSKLALIDEIENGIHYSALPTVFQGIRELSDFSGVQSIITTHSLECIQAACEVFKDKPEDFQIIRLERTEDDNVRAVAINDENLATVMASGWEIR